MNKAKDEQIAKLQNQVRILGADNEDLTAQLNKDQFYDASGVENDDVTEINVQELTIQDAILQEPLQELVEQASMVNNGAELVK